MDAKKNLIVDAVALAVYAVVANPALTGIAAHEWAGLGLVLVFLVHAAAHADWVAETTRSALRCPSWSRTGNLALDACIVVAFMVCVVSGILVSGAVLPALGYYAQGYYFWDPLHAVSAKVLLALLLVHVVVHARWFMRFAMRGKDAEHADELE
ncbi:DUF4405 domain-containing protein [Gordonibacter massiliensis (ex Traore et al. 2017)]|uniref:DUF4405 domain-containing protein n=1 Tax=Gordonibacter massiliensis (ex Traore et al. 2017) TaxID=1841863 RepID=A0A842JKY6_9ACTN|nr:DUF4405 domain-containing protein [Gordonibacter massiliensis (ex Traore et al. 2017)]MBC2889859.1 DUF4405 domain-containing protein [Gordonibacter massiliensis (ex Traore et al. 2017)]